MAEVKRWNIDDVVNQMQQGIITDKQAPNVSFNLSWKLQKECVAVSIDICP